MTKNTNNKNTNNKNSKNANISAISVRDITLITDNMMLDKILDKKELEKARKSTLLESVKVDGETAVLNPVLRDFYTGAYAKLETVSDNVVLAKRKLIVAVMDSDDFKKAFVSDIDFANSIGETKTFVSKAKSCVSTLNWLVEKGYGMDWTASQLDEIAPVLKKELKKDDADSFNSMLKILAASGKFTPNTSSRRIRELLADIVNECADTKNNENDKQDDVKADTKNNENDAQDDAKADTKNSENDTKNVTDDKLDTGICRIKLVCECNNGRKIIAEGKCAKGSKGDAMYKKLTKAIMADEKLVEMLRRELEKAMSDED